MIDKTKRFLKVIQLKNKQRAINKQYKKEGLTDDVLKKQVELNQLRHQYDISDETKRIYKNFVQ